MSQAKTGDNVTIHYTGKLTDGTIFDTSKGKEPLACVLGNGQVIPGFEEGIIGMSEGELKTITIPQDKAYGPHNPERVIEIPLENVPADIKPEIGMQLQLQNETAQPIVVHIAEITEKHVKLDGNHPLAGQDLIFDIELVSINAG